jgi:hypothetical protein
MFLKEHGIICRLSDTSSCEGSISERFHYVYDTAWPSSWNIEPADGRKELLLKIEALLIEMQFPWSAAEYLSKVMFKVDLARWLHPFELMEIVSVLEFTRKKMKKRT